MTNLQTTSWDKSSTLVHMTLAGAAPPGGRRAAAREEVAARAGDDPGVRGGGAPVVVQRVDVVGREAARSGHERRERLEPRRRRARGPRQRSSWRRPSTLPDARLAAVGSSSTSARRGGRQQRVEAGAAGAAHTNTVERPTRGVGQQMGTGRKQTHTPVHAESQKRHRKTREKNKTQASAPPCSSAR